MIRKLPAIQQTRIAIKLVINQFEICAGLFVHVSLRFVGLAKSIDKYKMTLGS